MILLLGASGYVGRAFANELRRRHHAFIPLTRKAVDYTNFNLLFGYIRETRPEFVINAAGHVGKPNVDACESARAETLFANAVLPQTVARACSMTNIPWGHVSSACIYHGAKWMDGRGARTLDGADLRNAFAKFPGKILGYSEWDEPNFSFRCAPCSFYSGTKALAEESIRGMGQGYIWRIGMPFTEKSEERNFLWKVQQYPKIYDGINSLTHLEDFVCACLDLLEMQASFGIYNVANPGAISTRRVVELIQRILKPDREFEFWKDENEFYHHAAKAPRSNCILDVSKLLAMGIKMRTVEEALKDSLYHWQKIAAHAETNGLWRSN